MTSHLAYYNFAINYPYGSSSFLCIVWSHLLFFIKAYRQSCGKINSIFIFQLSVLLNPWLSMNNQLGPIKGQCVILSPWLK